jgi:23S rRNA (uracil1939-C5)-methyltransferase
MTTHLVEIGKPVYGGAFLARLEGKALFVPLALPQEQARVRIVEDKPGYAKAEIEELVSPGPGRIVPLCPHFGGCGGCDYQHAGYKSQLGFKLAILRETLERAGVEAPGEIGSLAGEPWLYRNRVRLAFEAGGNPAYRARGSHDLIPIKECPIAAPVLIEAARAFAELRGSSDASLYPSELAFFCSADESELLATIFVPRATNVQLDKFARAFRARVPPLRGIEVALAGRRDERPQIMARWGTKSITYRAAGFDYRVDQGSFFQVNRWLLDALVERVSASLSGKIAWDLYAGVGLFARKLAGSFECVIAVESASAAMPALRANLRDTGGEAVGADALDFLRRAAKVPRPDLIVVDPPRTGLGAQITTRLAKIGAPAIVYVSCDPATLARDLGVLKTANYSIESIALADLFPQTFHIETVVRLRR